MGSPPNEKLTRREREIMDALFAREDGASAEDVREALTDPPGYSAVRAMLVRLEAKGFVRHREEGLRYVYVPTKSRASARRTALDKLVRVFFGGSPRDAVTALLNQEYWTDEELQSLQAQIEQVRKDQDVPRRES
jgi:predicted transcriptional regulator